MSTTWNVPGLPFPLSPSTEAVWAVVDEPATVTATAGRHTDIFIDPTGGTAGSTLDPAATLNAPTLLGRAPDGDFQFSARVSVEFAATYDAGVLLTWIDERHWGKLCFELSPDGEPMIVSVVARGVADDANAFVVGARTVWLRVSRIDRAFAYHASVDGQAWRMIRYFTLDGPSKPVSIGFEAQSPMGEGCAVTFDEIRFSPTRLAELRDGS
jgi:regulation of enolase protein 1 (concanavalin A-like superfamily)